VLAVLRASLRVEPDPLKLKEYKRQFDEPTTDNRK
jgi:hypothetical protein